MIAQAAKAGQKELSITPDVSHRFLLSANGFLALRGQVEEIFQKMRDIGVIGEAPVQPPPGEGKRVSK
jgi:hypothetical protein